MPLEIKNLSVSYDHEEWMLEKVNLKIEEGDLALICGPSGKGKTTLLSCINGIIPNHYNGRLEGTILLDGRDITCETIVERSKKVGSVLQNADEQIIYDLVEDEVAFALENKGTRPEVMEEIISSSLNKMKLLPEWRTKTLSGGQKQRLITATTLAMGQKVILLDEPLANLDIQGADLLLRTLHGLAKDEGYMIIIVEHRLDWVLPYCNKVLWVEDKNLKEYSDINSFKFFWEAYLEKRSFVKRSASEDIQKLACEESIFSLEDIAFTLKDRAVLKNISFQVKRGERWLVLGENGCGKTTLLKIIAGLIKPTGGRRVMNLKVGGGKKARMGVIMQNPNYQLFMPSVEQEILYSAYDRETGERMISAFGLEAIREKHPHSLSEGQKRKVGIAAILAMKPEVLLLDEPTVGQDYDSLRLFIEILNSHCQKDITMVTVTHDLRCLSLLGDRALWIKEGTIHRIGGEEVLVEYKEKSL